MSIHANNGGSQEVMGVMTGKLSSDTFVVLDSYALPVEATETRVNAMGEAYEYMVRYLEQLQSAGHNENIVGWYHSHPGYGCWLSRIDIGTQAQNQRFQDPFLAVVIDPNRTEANGLVEIGAFRTLPEANWNTTPGAAGNTNTTNNRSDSAEYESPYSSKTDKTADMDPELGLYAHMYYPLNVTYFKSPLDKPIFSIVLNEYWGQDESQSANISENLHAIDAMIKKVDKVVEVIGGLAQRSTHAGANEDGQTSLGLQTYDTMSGYNKRERTRKSRKDLASLLPSAELSKTLTPAAEDLLDTLTR